MTVPPVAELVGRISVKEHEMFSEIEMPSGWLVAFPRFERALQLLKKARKYIDRDWAKLDRDLEGLVFYRMAGLGPRKGLSKVVYGKQFSAVRGNRSRSRNRLGGVTLAPPGSASHFSQRQRMLMAQRPKPDRCEVCDSDRAKICWDHDHTTGTFRGWICQDCNFALGFVADSPERLRKLADYLDR